MLIKRRNLGKSLNCRKSHCLSKVKVLVKRRNHGERFFRQILSKIWSKITIVVQSRNIVQKSKFWSKDEILENFLGEFSWRILDKFSSKLDFLSKLEILFRRGNHGESLNFRQKSKFWSQAQILSKFQIILNNFIEQFFNRSKTIFLSNVELFRT